MAEMCMAEPCRSKPWVSNYPLAALLGKMACLPKEQKVVSSSPTVGKKRFGLDI